MALQGIRLTDIYGYDANDYNQFINNNIDVINSRASLLNEIMTRDEVIQNLYVNNLLQNKLGDSYNDKTSGLNLSQRLSLYNSLFEEPKESEMASNVRSITKEIEDGMVAPRESTAINIPNMDSVAGNEMDDFLSGDIAPYSQNFGSGLPTNMHDFFKMQTRENRVSMYENGDDTIENIINERLRNDNYSLVDQELFGAPSVNKDIDDYAATIRAEFDADPEFTYEFFKEFDKNMRQYAPYYNNRHDTYQLPVTPNEMKDIMAKYHAINVIEGPDKANEFGAMTFQNIAADAQSVGEKLSGALAQGGANFAGNWLAFTGLVSNLFNPETWIKAASGEWDDEELNFWQELWAYAADNPLTKLGNDFIETGTWRPDLIQLYKEYGYNPNVAIDRYGEENKFLNENTAYDLISQMAFTMSGMGEGAVVGAVTKNSLKLLTDSAVRKTILATTKKAPTWLPKLVDSIGNGIVVANSALFPAAAEASMDALSKQEEVLSESSDDIERALEAELRRDIEDGTFETFYRTRMSQIMSMNPDIRFDQETIGGFEQQIWDEYVSGKRTEIENNPDIQDAIRKAAFRAGARTMSQETLYIALGDMFFTNVLGGSAKMAKKQLQRAFGSDYSNFRLMKGSNGWMVTPKADVSDFGKVKYYGKAAARGLVEATEEGVEELFQNVDSQMNEDLAHDYIYRYIMARHDPDALDELTSSALKNFDVASRSVGENIFSPESIQAFLTGAVSAGIGSPTVISGIRQTVTNRVNGVKNKSFKDFIKNEISPYWRSPIIESIHDAKNELDQARLEAADINRWLSEHPEIDSIQDTNGVLSWMMDGTDAGHLGSERNYRDAQMGAQASTLLMMERIRGSVKEQAFSKKLKALSNLKYDGSAETEAVIDQALATQGKQNASEEERREVFDDIVSKAKDAVQLQNDLRSVRSVIESNFGNILSGESIDSWTFATVSKKDAAKRISDIGTTVRDAYNSSTMNDKRAATTASIGQNLRARYGSAVEAQRRLEALRKERDEVSISIETDDFTRSNVFSTSKRKAAKIGKKQYIEKYGLIEYENYLNTLTRQINEAKDAIRELRDQDEASSVIKEEQIAGLDAKAMWSILNPSNRGMFSKEQQKEIDAFLAKDGITKDILDSIKDAADLQSSYESFDEKFRLLQKDNRRAVFYEREIKSLIARKYAERALQGALTARSYKSFKEAYDAFMNDENMAFAKDQASSILGDNEYYKKYVSEERDKKKLLNALNGINEFKALSQDKQRIIIQLYNKAMQKHKNPTLNQLYDELTSELLNSMGIMMTEDKLAQFNSELRTVVNKFNKYRKRVNKVDSVRKNMSGSKKSDSSGGTIISDSNKDTILNNKPYNENRKSYADLFNILGDFFSGKVKVMKLHKSGLIQFMRLFTNDEIGDDIIVDLDAITISEKSFKDLSDSLQNTINSALQSGAKEYSDVAIANTQSLMLALTTCVLMYEKYKESSRKYSFKEYLQDVITNLDPIYYSGKKKDSNKVASIGSFSVKGQNSLSTEAEKKFYSDNNILDNLITLIANFRIGKQNKDIQYVFIKDQSLIDAVSSELGVEEFNSDNLPLVVAALVPAGTDGSVVIDGQNVLKVGLVSNSRTNPETDVLNTLNALRELALNDNENGVVRNTDGSLYVTKGFRVSNINRTTGDSYETKHLKDVLSEKYNGDIEKMEADFIEHTVLGKVVYYPDKKMALLTYHWKGVEYNIPYDTEWLSGKESTQYPVYIDEENPKKPIRLFNNPFPDMTFPEGKSLYEILDTENICDGLHEIDKNSPEQAEEYHIRGLINFVRKSVTVLSNSKIFDQFGVVRKKAISEINKIAEDYINFGKTKQAESPYSLDLTYKNGVLTMSLIGPDKFKLELSNVEISSANSNGEIEFKLRTFFQGGLKNLMFNEDGSYRTNDIGYELVKPQVKYDDMLARRNAQDEIIPEKTQRIKKYARSVILGNVFNWVPIKDNLGVDENTTLELNETSQKDPQQAAKNKVDAIERIKKGRTLTEEQEADRDYNREAGSIGVTTFISDISTEPTIEERVSMALGTSIDKLIRVYFRCNGDKTKVLKWMSDHKVSSFVGIGGQGNEQFHSIFRQIEKIDRFFKDRGETPITDSLLFTGKFYSENGKVAKLTAIPDIITVDNNGRYHIYDMKSFRAGSNLSMAKLPSFNNPISIYDRANISDKNIKKWTDQLSLYKLMLEDSGFPVDSIGIIPISLSYEVPDGVKLSSGNKYVVDNDGSIEIPSDRSKTGYVPLLIDSRRSTIYTDCIKLTPITDVSKISPDRWEVAPETKTADGVIASIKEKASPIAEKAAESTPVFLDDDVDDEDLYAALGLSIDDDPINTQTSEAVRCD